MLSNHNVPAVQAPDRRLLRAFAFDPMSSRLSGQFLTVDIPFETGLRPGPDGELVQVVDYDATRRRWYHPVDLDDPPVLAQDGLRPSESDPRSHQQIVYAITMSVIERFERFTGRRFRWRGDDRLRLVPHAFYGRNAYFDPERRAVLFGYYRADDSDSQASLPHQLMFTCLSVDIIAHEVTHAIVHRLRPMFTIATNSDVFAFHEAFADLVALFHHFLFTDIVEDFVAGSRSELADAAALLSLADEFGRSTGRGGPLRSAVGSAPDPADFQAAREPHRRGAIFVAAVFDAYLATYRSRIADLRRLATGGSGVLADGELSPDLVRRIAAEAVKNADRILGMVVRGFDYLPAVDVTFGDVVRAVITADRDLFPDDSIHLRGHLVEALRRRGIFPPGVVSLADQALLWRSPTAPLSLTTGEATVDLGQLILDSTIKLDPSASSVTAAGNAAQARSRAVYAQTVNWAKAHAVELGLDPDAGRIRVLGMHVGFQIGADGQPHPRIFIQIVQRREDLESGSDRDTRTRIHAACTVIANVDGRVAWLVPKPLPFTKPEALAKLSEPLAVHGREQHAAGVARFAEIREWFGEVEDGDPLAIWLDEPAVGRLTFASLHAPEEG
ncbi:hypothetical protein [Agromyces bracchium]|uniref:Peptidase M4 n=1 Tax=Agromyces bracchium TaxID=88376 RepID=A0A6I3M277_9MICO|nr:hypothetical protein [Agromyces bracchium]MTH67008.1 hypothetical protein [Agromyces bracchium]